jgi:hypothetical protein
LNLESHSIAAASWAFDPNDGESQVPLKPVGRVSIPDRPLNVNDLPTDVQEQLAKLRFHDVSFDKTPYIQPAERTESYTWDGGYLTDDWKTFRPNPGQEKEYEQFYKQVADNAPSDGFDYQPLGG